MQKIAATISPRARAFRRWLQVLLKKAAAWSALHPKTVTGGVSLLILWFFCLPRPLFDKPLSLVVEDNQGALLGARIAADGQWRFPGQDRLPGKYATCVVAYEDKRFWWHPGADPVSLLRAAWSNIRQGRVVSGGSTITMQVIRLARNNPPRTIWQKLLEVFMATRLEAGFSKKKILGLYAANAPFGGNVVGLEAACWRYYGKQPELLSWAEAATLAVLPNSPALIHPGRNRRALLEKRNCLLDRLEEQGILSRQESELAREEPLPVQPLPLPQLAPHLLDRLATTPGNYRFRTTVDRHLQKRITTILQRRQAQYRGNDIHNLAALVLDVPTGNVLAYVGNVTGAGAAHGEQVDIIDAPRSTGSILKPFLYALALENGTILPNTLLQDIPVQFGQYKPENYYESFDGVVPAKRALIRSLNVPFVLLLQNYGIEKFHFDLQRLGLRTLHRPPSHYGLSLILGGAEATLLDITTAYAGMARRVGNFYDRNGRVDDRDFRPAVFTIPAPEAPARQVNIGAAAIWFAFEAMQQVERPTSAGEWELFEASRRVAWKTGTSFGFRDAWAAGVTPRYAVGVWAGNADGEGRPGLLGVEIAAPVLFEIFEQLPPENSWFDPPYDAMTEVPVCRQSGYRAGKYCDADTTWIPKSGLRAQQCPYHQLLHLDPSGQWQVNSACEPVDAMQHQPWFVLGPLEAYYFVRKNPAYQPPPPLRPDCISSSTAAVHNPMQLIYPKDPTRIYVPVDLNGKLGKTVFQVAHRIPETTVYWHLDGRYLGSTTTFHEMALQPPIGAHTLTLVDAQGFRVEQPFEIIGKQ